MLCENILSLWFIFSFFSQYVIFLSCFLFCLHCLCLNKFIITPKSQWLNCLLKIESFCLSELGLGPPGIDI